jgi:Protein of unknown function (DUF4231)
VSGDEAASGGYWRRWLLGRALVDLDEWPPKTPGGQQTPEAGNRDIALTTPELQATTTPELQATLNRLGWSIQWHTLAERQARRWYTAIKAVQITAAAAIPVLTATGGGSAATRYLIAVLGALVVILEGIEQLKKYAQNALLWAQGKEALKHEYPLFRAQAGPYDGLADGQRNKLLATRTEQIIGQEVGRWAASREDSTGQGNGSKEGGRADSQVAPAAS